jgi:hypothetical protein
LALTFVALALVGAIVIRIADAHNFPSLGLAVWWALQTVTTVGYGDVVPSTSAGRVVGDALAQMTHAITDLDKRLDNIESRLGNWGTMREGHRNQTLHSWSPLGAAHNGDVFAERPLLDEVLASPHPQRRAHCGLYSNDRPHILERTSSGAACVNDCSVHPLVQQLPFGGVGNSGMGKYHGHWGSRRSRTPAESSTTAPWSTPGIKYPPYGEHKLERKGDAEADVAPVMRRDDAEVDDEQHLDVLAVDGSSFARTVMEVALALGYDAEEALEPREFW